MQAGISSKIQFRGFYNFFCETLAKLTVSTAKERGRVSTFPPLSSLPLDNSRTNRGNLAGAETFFICIFTRYAVAVSRAN